MSLTAETVLRFSRHPYERLEPFYSNIKDLRTKFLCITLLWKPRTLHICQTMHSPLKKEGPVVLQAAGQLTVFVKKVNVQPRKRKGNDKKSNPHIANRHIKRLEKVIKEHQELKKKKKVK